MFANGVDVLGGMCISIMMEYNFRFCFAGSDDLLFFYYIEMCFMCYNVYLCLKKSLKS